MPGSLHRFKLLWNIPEKMSGYFYELPEKIYFSFFFSLAFPGVSCYFHPPKPLISVNFITPIISHFYSFGNIYLEELFNRQSWKNQKSTVSECIKPRY